MGGVGSGKKAEAVGARNIMVSIRLSELEAVWLDGMGVDDERRPAIIRRLIKEKRNE